MKKKNVLAVIVILIASLVMVLDPFGFGTAKQYTANAVSIFAIALSIGCIKYPGDEK